MLLPWSEIGIALLAFGAATIGASSATGTIGDLDVQTAELVAVSTTVAGATVVNRLAARPAPWRAVLVVGALALVVQPAVIGVLFGYVGRGSCRAMPRVSRVGPTSLGYEGHSA
jgi:hypothetical protein